MGAAERAHPARWARLKLQAPVLRGSLKGRHVFDYPERS
jgi:hypothetical protein